MPVDFDMAIYVMFPVGLLHNRLQVYNAELTSSLVIRVYIQLMVLIPVFEKIKKRYQNIRTLLPKISQSQFEIAMIKI